MARYVLLEFADNEEAERFVKKQFKRFFKGSRIRVVGYFVRPTTFCKCGPLSERQVRDQCFYSRKTGLHVHRLCRRPRRFVSHSPRNLLDPDGIGVTGKGSGASAALYLAWTDPILQKRGESRDGMPAPNHPISVVDIEHLEQFRRRIGKPIGGS